MPGIKLSTLFLSAVGALFVILVVAMVAGSLRRPDVATYAPSPVEPSEGGEAPVGPRVYTVDATSHEDWVHFDFSRGSVVEPASARSLDWDIAFQRHRIITNGGATNPLGQAGAIELGAVPVGSRIEVPGDGWVADAGRGASSRNPVLEGWYDYSWMSHLLRPAAQTYAVRTADGRGYAVLRFQGYYCPGGVPGCVTFRYRYRADGGRAFPRVASEEGAPNDPGGRSSSGVGTSPVDDASRGGS
jgi:hypothetical protein